MSKDIRSASIAAQLILLLFLIFLFSTTSWAGDSISVNVATSKGTIVSGIKVYAFTEAGSHTGKYVPYEISAFVIYNPARFIIEA